VKESISFTHGVWGDVSTLPGWPWGNLAVNRSVIINDYAETADLLEALAMIAELVLQSNVGRVRYLLGAPLAKDTRRLVAAGIAGTFVAHGYFFIPLLAMPYLPRILRVLSSDMNDADAAAKLAAGVKSHMDLVRRIRKDAGRKLDAQRPYLWCARSNNSQPATMASIHTTRTMEA
jgi:hypothetical protein